MKNECPCLERDHCTETRKTYRSRSDHSGGHWEPPHPAEAYEGMTLHVYSIKLDDYVLISCADLQGEEVDDTTVEEALAGFLRSVHARVVDQSGGLFIKPSSFDYQLKNMLKFLDSLVRDGSVIDWDALTDHVLTYRSNGY